jgi:peptidoglycan/LPS O-acetylase OafA/YrhL
MTTPTAGKAPKAPPVHLLHVEGLRAVAAYFVFINHAYAQTWQGGSLSPPWYLAPFESFMVVGHLSVTVFIVISGFCLMLPVARAHYGLRDGALGFLKRRARRILPPYYGAVVLCLVLIWTIIGKPTGTLWDFPIGVSAEAIVSHALLLQDLFATSRINYVFWSIAVEWQIYFLFPLLVWCWRRYGPRATVATALVLGFALRFGFDHTRLARAAPHYVGLFALGMLAADLVQSSNPSWVRLRQRIPWGPIAIVCVFVTAAVSYDWGWRLTDKRFHLIDLPVGIAAMSVLVLTSSSAAGVAKRILSLKPLTFIGTFSYSVYLIHAPLLQVVWQYVLAPSGLSRPLVFAGLMGPGALAILAVSYAFFRVFEEPFMRQSPARVGFAFASPPAASSPAASSPEGVPPAALR